MRQTFADEIINAGYKLHPETVVISMPVNYLPQDDIASEFTMCQPVFDFCFVQLTEDNRVVSGAWIGKMDSGDYFVQFFGKRKAVPIIGYIPTQLLVEFEDGMVINVKKSSVNFVPPGNKFSAIVFPDDMDGASINFGAIMYAFYLMHQKAEVELVTPSRQVARQVERKTSKKPSPYFEIKVDPTKPQKRYAVSSKGRKKSAHIVRGNFATYSADAPLFGKYTGTFFRPAHARGVTGDQPKSKSYRIVLPDEFPPGT